VQLISNLQKMKIIRRSELRRFDPCADPLQRNGGWIDFGSLGLSSLGFEICIRHKLKVISYVKANLKSVQDKK